MNPSTIPSILTNKSLDLNESHARFLELLYLNVHNAFKNRIKIRTGDSYFINSPTPVSTTGNSDNDEIDFGLISTYEPHIVCVNNSHNYLLLMRAVLEI